MLSWIGFKDSMPRSPLSAGHQVSILVVVDWVQRRGRRGHPQAISSAFQSLLSWIGFKDVPDLKAQVETQFVSILVVVDWVQRLGDERYRTNTETAFQSLLSWIGFKDLGIVFSRLGRLSEFQSLLSWIGFKDLKSIPQTVPGSSCFNPCCRGLGSKTCRPHRSRQPGPCVSILVVVDWVQRLRPGDSALRCGSGFQSLLSWIGFKDILQTLLMSGQILVSILVVVDWVQRPRRLCG